MKKVAIPTRDNKVDDHFGHCDHYTIYTIENGEITNREEMPSPQGCGCKSGVATVLADKGVVTMLAGSMGEGAKNKLNEAGIGVIRGCSGDIETLIREYLAGNVSDSGEGCASHECGDHHEPRHHQFGFGPKKA